MKPTFIRSAYNYDMKKASDESALHCRDKTLTQQHHADECDINTIVRKFGLTGELPDTIRMPQYGDFNQVNNYHEAMNAVAKANEGFDALPAHLRSRFHNDPAEFIDFCLNDNNREEAIKLGLVKPAPVQEAPPPATPAEPPTAIRRKATPPKQEDVT